MKSKLKAEVNGGIIVLAFIFLLFILLIMSGVTGYEIAKHNYKECRDKATIVYRDHESFNIHRYYHNDTVKNNAEWIEGLHKRYIKND